ncbi:MAG: rRNA maturation RNase YbeY [Bacteroidota bacterium]|nr:rRNA maturation RNase YbeY [Bacteroidota bacterium]
MFKPKGKIIFHFLYKKFNLINRKALKEFVVKLFENEKKVIGDINYIFCSDDFLFKINLDYLNHDYYTDIITFPLHNESEPITADIFISIERIKENSLLYKVSFKDELLRTIIHGALHLCGYKDKTRAQIKEIRKKEDEYLLQCRST